MPKKFITSLYADNMYMYVGLYRGGVWKRPLSEMLGVTENKFNNLFSLYPNPAIDKLTINFSQLKTLQNTIVSIYDIQGKLLLQHTILQQQTAFNISQFARGIYVVKVYNDRNAFISKFVKE